MMPAYAGTMPVDHDSPVPLYRQLAAELRRRIAEEGLTRLPSLVTLQQEYEVSRPTAESAVKILIDAGEAYVVPGKGTWAGQPAELRTARPHATMRVMGCVACHDGHGHGAACHHQAMLQPPEIDRFSETPPYVQIADIIGRQVRDGQREPGGRLPSITDIVGTWGVNRTTAAKALRLLRDRGLARLSPGMGWYVPDKLPPAL